MAEREKQAKRYPTDLTDAAWEIVCPLLPRPPNRGRKPTTDLREVLNALRYMAHSGGGCRMLPKDFPPFTTVQAYFYEWRATDPWRHINHHLVMEVRGLDGKVASPSTGVIDSQGVKPTESGGIIRL